MRPFNSILALIFIIILCGSCERKKGDEQQQPAPLVTVQRPEQRDIVLTHSYPGYLSSQSSVVLVARVSGYLQRINYTPGSYVKKGTLLFEIEPTLYQQAVTQAQSALTSAKAQLDYARDNYARMQIAAQEDAVSEIAIKQAETAVRQSEASLKNTQAQYQTAKTQLSYCSIRAPFDGRVSENNVDVGSYINGETGGVSLASIYQDNSMYAYFEMSENDYAMLQQQMTKYPNAIQYSQVNIRVQSIDSTFIGMLDYAAPSIIKSTGTVKLRAIVANKENILRDGMYITVVVPYAAISQAILVENISIGTDQLGKYLYVVNDSNRVVYSPITVGAIYQDTLRLVLSGITAKDRYINKALLKVRPGIEVKIVSENTQK